MTYHLLMEYASNLPGAYLGFAFRYPAVRLWASDHVVLFSRPPGHGDQVSLKLKRYLHDALAWPCVHPTGHGLGRSGWVTVSLEDCPIPLATLLTWVDEAHALRSEGRGI